MAELLYRAKEARRRVKRLLNQIRGRDLWYERRVRCPTLRLGNEYGGWVVRPDRLSRSGVVYSFGLGRDISFDLAMIDRFGMDVHGFDPTPLSTRWIRQQSLPPQFKHHEIGLAPYDGMARFAQQTADPDWDTFILDGDASQSGREIEVPVMRLSSIMERLGHTRVDLVKMDIEYAEYPVIQEIANSGVRPLQLLVEFHYLVGDTAELERLREGVETVLGMGYSLFWRAGIGMEFSFLRTSDEPAIARPSLVPTVTVERTAGAARPVATTG